VVIDPAFKSSVCRRSIPKGAVKVWPNYLVIKRKQPICTREDNAVAIGTYFDGTICAWSQVATDFDNTIKEDASRALQKLALDQIKNT
jgi:hypothetical protein